MESGIDRLRSLFKTSEDEQDYESLATDVTGYDEDVVRPVVVLPDDEYEDEGEPFSWFEYSIFLLLGVAMLWAWYLTVLWTEKYSANI